MERAVEAEAMLQKHGFKLNRITSRGTIVYPTMFDFEKREVDRFRVEINEIGHLAEQGQNFILVQSEIMQAQAELIARGWVISETMLNRTFTDLEGPHRGKELSGVWSPCAKGIGHNYAQDGTVSYLRQGVSTAILERALQRYYGNRALCMSLQTE